MIDGGARAANVRALLSAGLVIPAHPLALTANRKLDERRQRALTPVGETVALGEVHVEDALGQRRQRRRGEADEAGGHLGVEEVLGYASARPVEHLEVLAGGVGDHRRGVGEARPGVGIGGTGFHVVACNAMAREASGKRYGR